MSRQRSKQWWKNTYNAQSPFDCIIAFQSMLNDKTGQFDWAKDLTPKEISFVYDMVSKANTFSQFNPTNAQSQWMVGILSKLKLMKEKPTKAAAKKTKSSSKKRTPKR